MISIASMMIVSWLFLSLAYSAVGLISVTLLWTLAGLNRSGSLRIAWAMSVLSGAVGLVAVFSSPGDYQQGQSIRFLYIHVPAALFALLAYSLILGTNLRMLILRHPYAGASAKVLALIGAGFTLLALFTGAMWGRRVWGVYWAWDDVRLTSTLAMFLVFVGLVALWQDLRNPKEAAFATAVLAFVGTLDLPLIHNSGTWWRTQHTANVFPDVSGIENMFLWPLGLMLLAFGLLFVASYLTGMRAEVSRLRLAFKDTGTNMLPPIRLSRWPIILACASLAGLAAFAYFITNRADIIAIDQSDWQSFHSDQLHLTLRFPKNWSAEPSSGSKETELSVSGPQNASGQTHSGSILISFRSAETTATPEELVFRPLRRAARV